MKYILLAALLSGITAYASNKPVKQIVITGTISGDTKGYDKIYCYGTGVPADSARIVNGTFKFIIPFKEPVHPLFYTEYDIKVKKGYQPFSILIDRPGHVTVKVKNISDGLNESEISGLSSAVLFHLFTKEQKNIYGKISATLQEQFGKSRASENDPDFKKLNESRDSLIHLLLRPFALKFVEEHRDSYASLIALFNSQTILSLAEIENSYALLPATLKSSKYGIILANHIEGLKNSMTGSIVKNFTLPDAENKSFNFDHLKGKFVVLDFWASWCTPCRKSFPHMREVYKKYQGKNIEFIGISIDDSKENWLKAVHIENNPWPQLIDPVGMHEKMFGVSAIPTTFLIDADGKIVLRETGFDPAGGEIESKLKEIFGE